LDQALADLSKALELDPKHANARRNRVGAYCQLGQWDQAAADYAKLLEVDPNDHRHWYRAAAVRLQIGDIEGYRRACREMLERFGKTDSPAVAEQTAKTCSLLPDAVSDFEPVVNVVDVAVKKNASDPWILLAKGLVEYRAGRPTRAIESLERVSPKADESPLNASACAVLALAQHHLGRVEEARAALASAKGIMARKMPDPGKGKYFGGDWHDWLRAQILVHEAEKLLDKDE
jgi:tetratricopeptide (TPR) repeat protein